MYHIVRIKYEFKYNIVYFYISNYMYLYCNCHTKVSHWYCEKSLIQNHSKYCFNNKANNRLF